jgi:nucleotide-binding universal stress UspA family protein
MRIVLAADGSNYTKKALAFLVTHESLAGPDDEIVVVHAQPALPPRVRSAVGSDVVKSYQSEEAEKVLLPIRRFLDKHDLKYRCEWSVGPADDQILRTAKKAKAHLIVMGTHGHGVLGRTLMGSVAQKVVTGADVPVMLVK